MIEHSPSGGHGAPKILAVDGPAGSGKSSICQRVARSVGWSYVNTGAIYRALGIVALRQGLELSDESSLNRLIEEFAEHVHWDMRTSEIFIGDENLTSLLHSEDASRGASLVATLPIVREKLLPVQRRLILQCEEGAIVDGRDIGTVVFVDADLKIFMTASLEERARRRLLQLSGDAETKDNYNTELAKIKNEIAARDEQDKGRGSAPLKRADDAILLDTSALDFDGAVAQMIALMRERGLIL